MEKKNINSMLHMVNEFAKSGPKTGNLNKYKGTQMPIAKTESLTKKIPKRL
ncbi:hypothetical protein P5G51_006950 [Virgibacillus sp. 179-BFC.A HS]|uniref:Uncharacterized protein n=1 Tax=Tigheibacillus jepli TaxID=3035914 RepID=A0ABU5CFU1_9BACI|nr:hypothetical protein [Virgibacillus sp. 179-BFC.A HS]MDY0405174.1 hypothetical protein [Virgibacillus sp. 179-BFC.A HS]